MKRADQRRFRKPSKAQGEKTIKKMVKAFKQLNDENGKDMAVVNDHYICYGDKDPLCEQPLGGKGLIKDVLFITCPECKMKLASK